MLAERFNGKILSSITLAEYAKDADILITSTGTALYYY